MSRPVPRRTPGNRAYESSGSVDPDDDHWSGERRRVDASFFRDYLGDGLNASSYMVAGPPGMAAAATEALKTIGVDEHLISTDSFSGY